MQPRIPAEWISADHLRPKRSVAAWTPSVPAHSHPVTRWRTWVGVFVAREWWWFVASLNWCFPSLCFVPAEKCGVPAGVGNANLADKYLTMQSFAPGQRVSYVCDVGYVQAGGSRYRSCVGGKWTPLRLRCERKDSLSSFAWLVGLFKLVEFFWMSQSWYPKTFFKNTSLLQYFFI